MVALSRAYRVPIEEERQLEGVPVMSYYIGNNPITDDEQYFRGLRDQTRYLSSLHDVHVDYATPELPIFYELSTPVLRAFKIYVYGTTTWCLKKWEGVSFSPGLISPATHDWIDDIIDTAYRLPGRELWSIGIIDVTLRQITYMAQVGRFAREEDLFAVFDELHLIVDHLERMARTGKRFPMDGLPEEDSPAFQVFHNELSNTNNAIIVKSTERSFMYSTLVNPNYVMADDPRILRDVNVWFERLAANGNALNAESGKYANQYFGRLRRQIDATKDRVAYANVIF